ncbi:MAG: CvpA family protein [Flavobacteriaceae bacterium]
MGFLDIILAMLLAYGLYKGLKNGFFVEIASLVALIAGLFGAIHFSYITGEYLAEYLDWEEQYIALFAFIATFVIIVILIHMVGKFLSKVTDFTLLGILNKIAGGIFGALKTAVIVGALLIYFDKMNNSANIVKPETIGSSILYTPLKDIGGFVFGKVLNRQGFGSEE